MLRYALFSLLILSAAAIAAGNEDLDIDKVNGSIHVPDNASAGKLSTVNGGIRIGAGAHAKSAETVNGGIDVGANATLDSLETVNGGLRVGEKTKIAKTVETVNGSITLDAGVDVGGGIETVSGDIDVGANSRVEGGILVEADHSWFRVGSGRLPRIVIGPHATVQGTLNFKRDVELYVSDSATIGDVQGAKPVKFSGDRPSAETK